MTTQEFVKKEQISRKLNSIKLCLQAHPDNQPDSEFEDRIYDIEYIEQKLSAERERYDELKSKYDALVMDNMTHEYNAAEAQRHLPDLIKQYVDCERERAGKLVEALRAISAYTEDNFIQQKANQTLNEYDTATKES